MNSNLFDLTFEEFVLHFLNLIKEIKTLYKMDFKKNIQSIFLNLYKPDVILIHTDSLYEVAYGKELLLMLLYMHDHLKDEDFKYREIFKKRRIRLYIIEDANITQVTDILSRYMEDAHEKK